MAIGQRQKTLKLNSKTTNKQLNAWKTDSLGMMGERWKISVKYDLDSFVNKLDIESFKFYFGKANMVDTILNNQNPTIIYQYITYQKMSVIKRIEFEFKQVDQKFILNKIYRTMSCG